MEMKKIGKMGSRDLAKKGLLSKLLDFLRGPSENDFDTLSPVRDVSGSQHDAKRRSPVDSPYLPAEVERRILAEAEIVKSRRPEQYAQRFN